MDKPTLSTGSRFAHRSLLAASVVAATLVVVSAGGCGESRTGPGDGNVQSGVPSNSSTTNSSAPGAPTIAVNPGGTGTSMNTGGPASPGGPSGSVENPGGVPTPGNSGTGGSSPNGPAVPNVPASGGNEGTVPEPCVDVEPPPTEEWPDATCARWAAETEECSETWFASYCDVSCGRCVPASGVNPGPGTPEPPPCVDVEPPPTEEWPDATCARWAAETEECSETWFANYCDVSCGRCVPAAGETPATPAAPEPKPCEDVAPPPSAEWPDATCENWALETDECGAGWFANYCDISCGRCVPEGGLPPTPMAPDCSGEGLPDVTGGEGFSTRYWDCCQTHCSQQSGRRCGQDGSSGAGDQTSSCNGGGSFACYDEAPRAVSECLSYGHIAKSNPNCGACYRIQFTGAGEHNANDPGSRLIKGKQMIVKVSNTGGDVAGNQFDLMIPGGGVGQFNACSRQWGTNDLGAQYGGFLASCTGGHSAKKECVREQCAKIPAGSARDGCLWFVDWFQVADNPKFTSQQVNCPF